MTDETATLDAGTGPDTSSSSTPDTSTVTTPAAATPATNTKSTDKPKSTREVLSDAFDKIQKERAEADAKPDATKPGVRKVDVKSAAKPDVQVQKDSVATDANAQPDKSVLPEIKAPQSLSSTLKEDWGKVPREYQDYIAKRELETSQKISQMGVSSKFGSEVQSMIKPFETYIQRQGMTPAKFLGDLVGVAKILQDGTPEQRAKLFWDMHRSYMNTTNWQVFGQLQKGQNPNIPQAKPQVDIDAEVEKRLQARTQESAKQATEGAAKAFYEDPANEFAGELDPQIGAAINGGFVAMKDANGNVRPIPDILKDAYEFALKNSASHQALLQKRGTNGNNVTYSGNTAQPNNPNAGKPAVRQAAPSPGGGKPVKPATKTYKNADGKSATRKAAEDAWDEISGR